MYLNVNVLYEYHPTKNPIDTHTHTHTHTPLEKVLPSSRKTQHHATPPFPPSPPANATPPKKNTNATVTTAGPARGSSKSSSVKRRFCAVASCRFKAYSAQTRWESTNSASQVCTWWNPLGWLEPGVGGG